LAQQSIELEADKIKQENDLLFVKAEQAFASYDTLQSIIRKIAINIEKIYELRDQSEFISEICNLIIREFRNRGLGKLESSVYKALSDKQFSRFKNERYSARGLEDSSVLPEEITIEMSLIKQAIEVIGRTQWSRYQDEFVTRSQSQIKDAVTKVENYQDSHNIIRYDRPYDVLTDNFTSSDYSVKRPVVEPPIDESLNVIRMQYEYLKMDIASFIHDFVKRYYPPDEEMPYYARSIWAFRKLFNQYQSKKIHRDYYSWSEIYAADEGFHPTGKSAKEISARHGAKVRRYDKTTGAEIFGRKGICKEQIQKKKPSLVSFMQQVYHMVPLFMFIHRQYSGGKERIFVDHAIDIKDKRQFFA
jgi:hypothetical protein